MVLIFQFVFSIFKEGESSFSYSRFSCSLLYMSNFLYCIKKKKLVNSDLAGPLTQYLKRQPVNYQDAIKTFQELRDVISRSTDLDAGGDILSLYFRYVA